MLADGLADREHVPFVEAQVERAAAVAGGAEADSLPGYARDPAVRCNRR